MLLDKIGCHVSHKIDTSASFYKVVAFSLGTIFALHLIVLATTKATLGQSIASQGLQTLSVVLAAISAGYAAVKSRDFARTFWTFSSAGFALVVVALVVRHFESGEGFGVSDFLFLLHMAPFGLILLLNEGPRARGATNWPMILDYMQVLIIVVILFIAFIYTPSKGAPAGYIHSLYALFGVLLIARNIGATGGFWFRTLVASSERERLAFRSMGIYLLVYTVGSVLTHYIFLSARSVPVWIELQGSVPFLTAAWLFSRWQDLPGSVNIGKSKFRKALSLHLIPAILPLIVAASASLTSPSESGLARLAISGSLVVFALRLLATIHSEYRASDAARQGEQRYYSLALATAQIVWTTNSQGELGEEQSMWSAFSGMPQEELRGWGWIQAVHPDDREQTKTAWSKAVENSVPCDMECRLRRHDGEYRHMAVRGVPVPNTGANIREWVGACTDITERKRAEENLRRSEERYRSVVAAMSEGVVVQQADGTIIACNRSGERILGVLASEIAGRASIDVQPSTIHEDGSPFPAETHPSMVVLRTGKPASNVRMGIRKPEGGLSWILINAEPIYHETENTPYAVVTTFTDDTKRREAEEQVRRASLYTRSLIEASPDPLVTISPQGKITDVNVATETVTGLSREHLIGSDFCDYFTEPKHAREGYQQAFEKGSVRNYPLAIRHVSGSITHVLYNATVFKNQSGQVEGVFAAARDISERKILEERLLQAQKLEAVGRLAGGVAHDFNNLLGVILGSGELLLGSINADDQRRQYVDDIISASNQGASLTQQLLTFSRKHPFSPVVIDLNSIVKETGHMLPRVIGEHIEIAIVLSQEKAPVLADPTQIQQILLNLATNSRDAMPEGGRLRIEIGACEMRERGQSADVAPGHYVTLTISDTGVGMSPRIQSHAFDPFFTTKDVGKGTGLGLSMVYGIVKESGGAIVVDSEPGKGTTFRIYLPKAKAEPRETAVATRVPDESLLGSETILLVEDRSDLRNLTRKFLQKLGYKVLDAGLPEEAIQIARQFVGRIDLLLTDILMPGMNGRELAKRLRPLYTDMRILYVSGFDDQTYEGNVADANDAFMQKPFHPQDLARTIRELLRAPRPVSQADDIKHIRAS